MIKVNPEGLVVKKRSIFQTGDLMFNSLQDKHAFLANYASMRYWQIAFWGFLCVVNFFTLTLWYSQPNLTYTIPVMLQSALGLFISIGLQRVIVYLWQSNLAVKIILNLFLVAIVALIWTLARMFIFEFSTRESHIWQDLGGWYFSSIFIFTSWIALFYGIQYYRLLQEKSKDILVAEAKAREERIKNMEAQTAAQDAQLAMLRYQLNPHFLSNTLNAINALIEMEQNEKAQAMTVNLSQFLRYSLDTLPEVKITLEDELQNLLLYLRIEETRFEDRLKVDIKIEDTCKKALVPSLLLQPIIENSMKHAIAKNELGGTIKIVASVSDAQLILCIEDSGSGIELDEEKLSGIFNKGVGLKNTNQRLKILYEEKVSVLVKKSSLGGLKTRIQMPLQVRQ